MPSARMAPDGDLSFVAGYFKNTQHYNLGFQFLPWLETTFKYSGLTHFDPDFPVDWDRSFSLKARLWDEGSVTPALAIGINDLVGTGIYSGEYVVATKQFGDFDTSIGMGWGRLSTADSLTNPFCTLSKSFCKRTSNPNSTGGNFNLGQYFHGANIGLFGGVNWQTPIKPLTLQVEYSSDAYTAERASGNFHAKSQLNIGVNYHATDSTSIGLSYIYGQSIMARVSFDLDTSTPHQTILTPSIPAPQIRTDHQQQTALNKLFEAKKESKSLALITQREAKLHELVDALFADGVENIRLDGQNLTLFLPSSRSGRQYCQQYAQLAYRYGFDFKALVLSDSSQAIANSVCTPSYEVPLVQKNVLRNQAQLTAAVINIDAADGSELAPEKRAELQEHIRKDIEAQRIKVEALDIGEAELTIYYSNYTYFSEAKAVGRLIRVLMVDAPADIEKFRLVSIGTGPEREFDVIRAPLERAFQQKDDEVLGTAVLQKPAALNNPILSAADLHSYPRFYWYGYPQFRQQLFDPASPFGVQFVGVLGGGVELLRGLVLGADIEGNIYDNFNTNRPSNSVLPHVRTDFNQYFTRGKNGIADLETAYRFRLAPTVFAVTRAGYLESMFAGGGGEILWRPEGQRWALGVDGYEVWQRGFDRLFDFQHYRAFTGHVALYYNSPWYNLNFVVRAGQYLAKDRGVTLEITRRFSTGVTIGAFATKTNISSAQFGEGSFDKGIFISIPINWAFPIETQTQLNEIIRPIQRDGGQRLLGDATLYDETERTSFDEVYRHADYLSAPDAP